MMVSKGIIPDLRQIDRCDGYYQKLVSFCRKGEILFSSEHGECGREIRVLQPLTERIEG